MTTKARRIGGDWVESVDPRSGKVYYANMKTKETSWTMPEEVKQFQEQRARQATLRSQTAESEVSTSSVPNPAAASSTGGADDQWLERQDPRTGRIYYYNPKLKQTSWTRPDKTVTAATTDPSFGKGAWVARVDPRTNRTFYFNTVTKMTSWTNPDEEEKKPAQQKTSMASRISKRISFSPKASDQPAYEAEGTPAAPTNRTSARTSIRLGAMGGPKAGSRLSMADIARQRKAEATGAEELEPYETPDLGDRFAKLRALRNRANPGVEEEEEEVQEKQINLDELADAAMQDVDYDLDFRQYAQEFMNMRRKGWGKKPVTVDKLTTWKPEKIKSSLHALNSPALVHDAILAFTNILCYMGDKPSKNPMANANKVLRITCQCPEELRDEVYAQLIKQTTQNPNPHSCLRGWELIVFCAGSFPPSDKLHRYLMSYLKQNAAQEPHPGVSRLANYALVRLQRTIELGPRNEAPTEIEIQAAREVRPVTVRIHMLDGSITPLEAECWTTVAELNEAMSHRYKIKDPTPFSIFEINNMDEERMLEDDDRILDILAYWDRERAMVKRAKNAPSFQFVYKVKLFFDIREDDEAAIEVAYHQAVHDVVDSRYPCTEEDSFRLAALQAQHRFGDYDGSDVFGNELSAFLPAKYYHPDIESDLKAAIMETYKLLKGYDQQEAMHNYLDYVKAWKIYGSAYFFVEPQNSRAELPPDVVLAVNAHGVLIVDPSTKEFLAEYPYSEVVTWGHSSITFVLVVGNLIRQNKLYFKTDQGSEINTLIHAYVQRLVEE